MRIRKIWAAAAVACLAAGTLTACSGGSGAASGPITVEFWHSMTGAANGPALEKLIDEYNQANEGKVVVKGVFSGTYDELIAKYKTAAQTGQTPTMSQVYDVGSRFMIDSGTITPMQNFIDAEKYDVSDLQPNVAGYYTIDNKLYSMPFNTSMPVMYYNKDVFKKAGLDPEKPPTTLDEIRADAQKIKDKNAAQYPFTAAIYGWFVEQEIASNGDLYCSPDNGRGSSAPDKMTFDNANAVQFFTWWKKMIDDGLSTNVGRDTTQAQSVFSSGSAAMTLESTGALGGFVKNAQFEVGVGYYPKVQPSDSGPIIGGASLWISGKGHSDEEQQAAWDFIKFVASAKSQAEWHVATGYFPISKGALNEANDVAYRQQYPQFDVAVQQLADTKLSPATQGCSAGIMPQSRKAVEDALEQALTTTADPQQVLTAAAQSVDQQLADYTKSLG